MHKAARVISTPPTDVPTMIRKLFEARRVVENSPDDESGMKKMADVYAAESAILSAPLKTRAAVLAARTTLYEDGQIDFADHFKAQLVMRLLQAI
ncbi:hypothetical protein [Bradyrhizobium sp. LA2.1]|uniref:hypothetical protein n=1 Tax=Bradyrhizobium sp. LA2.1 TaxID=3156376 RepID=UPI0033990D79